MRASDSSKVYGSITAVLVAASHHRAALGVIRSLGRAGYPVTAAFANAPSLSRCESSWSRYIHELVRCPDPGREFLEFQAWLQQRVERNPDECFLPVNESAVAAAAVVRCRMGEPRRFVIPSDEHLGFTLSKVAATQKAASLGVPVPRFVCLRRSQSESLHRPAEDLAFPLIVKWDNYVDEQGAYRQGGNCVARDCEMLDDILAELEPSPCAAMVQEVVPGKGVGSFFLFHGGKLLLRFAHRRLHEVPWSGGVSSLSESSDDAGVLEAGERLLKGIGYEGVAMVEFRQQPGKPPVFLEINGRLWGSLGLALQAGADFPRAMVDAHLKGTTSVSQPELSKTIRCRNLPLELEHVGSVFKARRDGFRNAPSRLRSVGSLVLRTFDPRTRSDLLWVDDPGPALAAFRRLMMDTAHRVKTWLTALRSERRRRALLRRVAGNSRRVAEIADEVREKGLLFLCYGNICRSPYALARWNALQSSFAEPCVASSAGFHPRADRTTPARFQAAATRRGIDLAQHRSQVVTPAMLENAGLIVVMDVANAEAVEKLSPAAIAKTVFLRALADESHTEISDPYGQPLPAGAVAYAQIDSALLALGSQLVFSPTRP